MYKVVRSCRGTIMPEKTVSRHCSYLRAVLFVLVVYWLNWTRFPLWLAFAIRYRIERERSGKA